MDTPISLPTTWLSIKMDRYSMSYRQLFLQAIADEILKMEAVISSVSNGCPPPIISMSSSTIPYASTKHTISSIASSLAPPKYTGDSQVPVARSAIANRFARSSLMQDLIPISVRSTPPYSLLLLPQVTYGRHLRD